MYFNFSVFAAPNRYKVQSSQTAKLEVITDLL